MVANALKLSRIHRPIYHHHDAASPRLDFKRMLGGSSYDDGRSIFSHVAERMDVGLRDVACICPRGYVVYSADSIEPPHAQRFL